MGYLYLSFFAHYYYEVVTGLSSPRPRNFAPRKKSVPGYATANRDDDSINSRTARISLAAGLGADAAVLAVPSQIYDPAVTSSAC